MMPLDSTVLAAVHLQLPVLLTFACCGLTTSHVATGLLALGPLVCQPSLLPFTLSSSKQLSAYVVQAQGIDPSPKHVAKFSVSHANVQRWRTGMPAGSAQPGT
jgi:hypothetical protein